MVYNEISEAVKFYNEYLLDFLGEPEGVSLSIIDSIQEKMNIEFPESYIQVLRWMGNKNGVFAGSNMSYKVLGRNRVILDNILAFHEGKYSHPSEPVVFFTHQGYIANWFYYDGKNMSDIFSVSDDEESSISSVCNDFNSYLLAEFSIYYEHRKKYPSALIL